MTDPMDAARAELTPPGFSVSQAEQDSWLRRRLNDQTNVYRDRAPPRWRNIDPRTPISPLAARLLLASNAFHSKPVDGTPAAEAGTTRHARFGFHWGK